MYRNRFILGAVLLGCLLVGAVIGYTYAQPSQPPFPSGHVFTGNEVGFRVDGMMYGKPARATLLIKIDGGWHEFMPNLEVTPLAK